MPLHYMAKAGSWGVMAFILLQMRVAALHKAVRLSHAAVVVLLMAEAPELTLVTTDEGRLGPVLGR